MRVGRIGYINCFPVYGAIDRGHFTIPGKLITGTPNELNDLLAARELGVSVVSAVEYARNAAQYQLLPDLAISSDGPVQSVLFFSRRPVSELTGSTVLVSQSSRTSVLLLELMLADLWNVSAQLVPARAEAGDLSGIQELPHDGVLVIGDAALHLAAAHEYQHCYDLGLEWKRWTGLPFVFAVWAARREANQAAVREVHQKLLLSRDWGLKHLDELAEEAALASGFDKSKCRDYLNGLDYALSDRHIAGLSAFFSRLEKHGVAPGALSFLSVA